MTKFLFAIVLLVMGIKLTAEHSLVHTYEFFNLEQDENGGNEKGEKGKSKFKEDLFYHYTTTGSSPSNTTAEVLKLFRQQDVYYSFFARPNTPPPNRVYLPVSFFLTFHKPV
jgi:hypothetical protein